MKLTYQTAWALLLLLLALLLFGTQMPGAWRDEAFRVTQLPWQLTKVAHFVLFAALAAAARLPPLRWSIPRVLLATLALALLTEALQLLAANRNPTWHDVLLDQADATLGLLGVAYTNRQLKSLKYATNPSADTDEIH